MVLGNQDWSGQWAQAGGEAAAKDADALAAEQAQAVGSDGEDDFGGPRTVSTGAPRPPIDASNYPSADSVGTLGRIEGGSA